MLFGITMGLIGCVNSNSPQSLEKVITEQWVLENVEPLSKRIASAVILESPLDSLTLKTLGVTRIETRLQNESKRNVLFIIEGPIYERFLTILPNAPTVGLHIPLNPDVPEIELRVNYWFEGKGHVAVHLLVENPLLHQIAP